VRELLQILDNAIQRLHDAEQARLLDIMEEATAALNRLADDLRAGRISVPDARRIGAELKGTLDAIKNDLDANDIALAEARTQVRGQVIAEA